MVRVEEEARRVDAQFGVEDAAWLALHNAHARPSGRLYAEAGPVPALGAVTTAPVLLLLTHPAIDAETPPADYRFAREGGRSPRCTRTRRPASHDAGGAGSRRWCGGSARSMWPTPSPSCS
jgi:hypothetical protein